MSMQFSDTVIYHWKNYELIDVEINHSLIRSAEFFPEEIEKRDGIYFNSACYRGYFARYLILNRQIYGQKILLSISQKKKQMILNDPNYHFSFERDNLVSEVKPLNYSGSIIIAREDDLMNSDFLSGFLESTEAYEIHFTNGKIDEMHDLNEAIQAYKNHEIINTRESNLFARKYLKYTYGPSTYRWTEEVVYGR